MLTGEGTEPDYRFSLANERTFLAWIRTALALLAGALALQQFGTGLGPEWVRTSLGILLAVLGLLVTATSYRQWAATESAMRRQVSLPRSPVMPVLSVALSVVALAAVVVLVAGLV